MNKPPPYEKKVEFKELYPQLPVMAHEGDYRIVDDEDRIIERGQAETLIKMYPSSKSKKKASRLDTGGGLKIKRRMSFGDDQSDEEENLGAYDPAVRRILAKAEKKGNLGDKDSNDSEDGDSDDDWGCRGASASRGFFPEEASTRIDEHRQRAMKDIERSIDECITSLNRDPSPLV